jgi:hypothetical protein
MEKGEKFKKIIGNCSWGEHLEAHVVKAVCVYLIWRSREVWWMLDKFFCVCELRACYRERVFSFSYAAAGNTVMSYGPWTNPWKKHWSSVLGLICIFILVVWRLPSLGMGLAQPTHKSQAGGYTIIRARHGIRSLINRFRNRSQSLSLPFL